ncbi:MAG: hypothetical protein AAF699_17865 [Pseudomonadota bacterium]
MRFLPGLAIGVIALASASISQAQDTSTVMCEQFAISGAMRDVVPVTEFGEDFSPAHHAPRNIPIEVTLSEGVVEYIHFPIVEDGTYLVYTTEPDRLTGLKMKSGDAIASTKVAAPEGCADVLKGGLTADIEAGTLKGPLPIAIELGAGAAGTLQLIVSRNPIN